MPFDPGNLKEVDEAPVYTPDLGKPFQAPSMGYLDAPSQESGKFDLQSAMQSLAQKPEDLYTQQKTFSFNWDETNAAKYVGKPNYNTLGFNPELGPLEEERYASAQTGWDQFKNATIGGFMGAGKSAWDQFKSWKDTVSVFQDPSLQSAFHKDELDAIAEKERNFQNDYPIYESQADRDNFFSWGNFYRQVQGVGPLAGSIAEMIAENAAVMAIIGGTAGMAAPAVGEIQAARDVAFIAKATNNSIKESIVLGKTIDRAGNLKKAFQAYKEAPSFRTALDKTTAWAGRHIGQPLGESLQSVSNLLPGSNTARFLGQGIEDLGRGIPDIMRSQAMVRTVAKGVGSFYMDMRDLNLSISMAQGHASGLYHSSIAEWSEDFRKKTGELPSGSDLQEIQDLALQAAKTNGALGAMAMLYTNKLAFGNILKGNKGLQAVIAQKGSGLLGGIKVVPEFLRKGGDKLFIDSKWYSWKSLYNAAPSKIGHGLGFGLTVGAGEAVTEMSKAYFDAKYSDKDISWADAFKESIDKQFSKEGAQTFISSFLTGVLVPGIGGEALGKIGHNLDRVYNKKGWEARTSQSKVDAQGFVDRFNTFYKDPLSPIRESIVSLNSQASFKDQISAASELGKTKLFNDLKDDAFREFMIPAIRNGHADIYLDHLKDFTENLTTKELFENLFPGLKYEDNNELGLALQDQIKEFQGRALDLDTIYKDVYRKFPNPHNPYKYEVGTPEYEKAMQNYVGYQTAVDFTVFSKDHTQRSLERQAQILNGTGTDKGIRGMEIFRNVPFSSLYNFTDDIYLKGAIETLTAEAGALTGSEKTASESQLKAYQNYHDLLLSYKEKYGQAQSVKDPAERLKAEEDLDKKYSELMKEPFSKVINHELKEDGEVLSEVDKKSAIDKYLDYYKLGVESKEQLKFYNVVIDPNGNWGEYTKAVIKAYKEHDEAQKRSRLDALGVDILNKRFWVDDILYSTTKVDEDGTVHYSYLDENNKTVKGTWSKEFFDANIKDKLYEEKSEKVSLDSRAHEVTAKGGKAFTFRAGDIWVGPPKNDETGIWNDKEVALKKNNKIKILEISKDGKSATAMIDGNPKKVFTLQSIADLAEETKWVNYETLSPDQQEFLNLRNFALRYRVIKKDRFGKTLYNKSGKPQVEEVTGRVVLDDKKENLLFKYNNERSGKAESIPFDRKYVLNKGAIEPRSIIEKRAAEARQARLETNFNIQKTRFENLIRETESRLEEIAERKTINEGKFQEHLKEIDDLKESLEIANMLSEDDMRKLGVAELTLKELKEKGTKPQTKIYKQAKKERDLLKQTLEDLNKTRDRVQEKVDKFQETSDSFIKERDELLAQEQALKDARDFQYEALNEILSSETPFDREGGKTLSENLERRLAEQEENRLTGKPELVDQLLKDTRDEIDLLDDRIGLLVDSMTAGRDFLSKVRGLERIYDDILLKAKEGKEALKKYLWELRNGKDPDSKELAIELLRTSTDPGDTSAGIQRAYIKEVIKRVVNASKEFDKLSERKDRLVEKETRLKDAQDQNVEVSSLQDRIEFLRMVQDSLQNISVSNFVLPKPVEWDAEKEKFEKENKLATSVEVDNEGEFFTETPKFAFNGNIRPQFYPGVIYRTQGRQYEPEHFVVDDGHGIAKFYIFRDKGTNKITARVLDKTRYPKQRADYLQNVADSITSEQTLFALEEGTETTHHYAPGKADIKITRFENDSVLNMDEKNAEAHALNSNIDINNVKLSVITEANDIYGIRNTQAFQDDIKLLYVDPTTNKPIDLDGNIIENPTKDNVIYRSLQGSPNLLDNIPDTLDGKTQAETNSNIIKFIESPAFKAMDALFDIKRSSNKAVPFDEARKVFEEVKQFAKFRERIKQEVKQNGTAHLNVTGKSSGIPNKLPKVSGEVQKHNVEGRIVEKGTDWLSPKAPNGMGITLKVANTSDVSTKGIRSGRLVWVREDGQKFPADNRALSLKERENLINSLRVYGKYYNKTYEQLVQERGEAEAEKILNNLDKVKKYLNATVFWGVPSKSQLESGKVGKNRLWVVDDILYRSTKDGISRILLIDSELAKAENQAMITDGLFHQVNSKMVNDLEAPYDEYIVSKSGDVTAKPYDNYLHYLTSKVDENGVPVVYTNIIEHTTPKEEDPQSLHTTLKQVNLQFRSDDYIPTPEQAKREEAKNVVELDLETEAKTETVFEETSVPKSFNEIMTEEIEAPEGVPEEVKGGLLKYTIDIPGSGSLVFHSFEGELLTTEEAKALGFDSFAPKLIKETKVEVEASKEAAEPLVTTEPKTPIEPPKPEMEEDAEVAEEEKPTAPKEEKPVDKSNEPTVELTQEEKDLLESFKICDTDIL